MFSQNQNGWFDKGRKMFRRATVVASLCAALSGSAATSALAHHLDFTLHNRSSRSILLLYVAQAGSGDWGRDILPGALRRGRSVAVTFPGQGPSSPCLWDVKVVYDDFTQAIKRFDFCDVSVVNAYD